MASLSAEQAERVRWQSRLLRPMLIALSLLTLFFVSMSVWQGWMTRPRDAAESQLGAGLDDVDRTLAGAKLEALPVLDLRTRLALERYAIDQRYAYARSVVASRTWVRLMSFVTGMVLALVGSFFVLGRLETSASELSGDVSSAKWSLVTTSPGLVLATLGTVLMLAAIVVKVDTDVKDTAAYIGATSIEVAPSDSATAMSGRAKGVIERLDRSGLGPSGKP